MTRAEIAPLPFKNLRLPRPLMTPDTASTEPLVPPKEQPAPNYARGFRTIAIKQYATSSVPGYTGPPTKRG